MRIRWVIVLTAGLLFWGWCLFASEPVSISIFQRTGTAPHTFIATVKIEPHEGNREVCLRWGLAEEGIYSSSCDDLEGLDSKRAFQFTRTLEYAGRWHIIADLTRNDGSRHRATAEVLVVGGYP